MLSDNLISIINNRVTQELEDRRVLFEREVAGLKEGQVSVGSLYSGATVRLILDAIGNEYRIRTSLIWQAFARALGAADISISDEICSEVKDSLAKMLDANSMDLPKSHQALDRILRGSSPKKSVEELRTAALERTATDIDYAVLRNPESPGSPPTVLNINQGYGIIQAGSGSSASLNISVGHEERLEIEKVIKSVRQLLEQPDVLNSTQGSQTKELLSDLEGEIDRSQPNGHRIRGALQGLATIVQTVAAAPLVYQVIKGAAALFGLPLP